MKIKNKILLASAGLIALTGAAAGTGTYAWYTANRLNTLNVSTISAKAMNGDLGIKLAHGTTGSTIAYECLTAEPHTMVDGTKGNSTVAHSEAVISGNVVTPPSVTITDTTKLVDATIDPATLTFTKAVFGSEIKGSTAASVIGFVNEANYRGSVGDTGTAIAAAATNNTNEGPSNSYNYGFYHKFTLEFSISNGGGNAALYISPSSTVTSTHTETTTLVNSIRFAAISNATRIYSDPKGDASECKYAFSDNESINASTNPAGYTETAIPTGEAANAFKVLDNTFYGTATNYNTSNRTRSNYAEGKGYLGMINEGSSINVDFYYWIEGTDPDTVINIAPGFDDATFTSNLQFYALLINDMAAGA